MSESGEKGVLGPELPPSICLRTSSEYQSQSFYKYTMKYTKPVVAKNYTISMMKMLGYH